MKFFGALQPHRADSNFWNDSIGGHTINKNYNANSNITTTTSSNRLSKNSNQIKSESYRIEKKARDEDLPHQKCGGQDEKNDGTKLQGTKTKSFGNYALDMICIASTIVANMTRTLQSLHTLQSSNLFSFLSERCRSFRLSPSFGFSIALIFLCVFTNHALCDENENGSSMGPEFTTLSLVTIPTMPPFDNATRGNKKFGDRCEDTVECGFPGSICDPRKKSCQCIEDLPVTNHLDKCGKEAAINESCFFNEQCEAFHFQTECRSNRCACRFDMSPVVNKDGNMECKGKQMKPDEVERYVDPAMIGVLVGMALMFIIICVVLRLFSRARWRENRTIFNTPNPRLMNVSLLRDNKLMHGQERRGSRMSVRAPSRQPSMASLRPHSPNPSLGSRPGSRGSSNTSAVSARSTLNASANTDTKPSATSNNCPDNNQSLIITNIIENPAAESVTIEILQPKSNQHQ